MPGAYKPGFCSSRVGLMVLIPADSNSKLMSRLDFKPDADRPQSSSRQFPTEGHK